MTPAIAGTEVDRAITSNGSLSDKRYQVSGIRRGPGISLIATLKPDT
jgi:hypothetical protein